MNYKYVLKYLTCVAVFSVINIFVWRHIMPTGHEAFWRCLIGWFLVWMSVDIGYYANVMARGFSIIKIEDRVGKDEAKK